MILATPILHNIATLWNEVLSDRDVHNADGDDGDPDKNTRVIYAISDTQIRRIRQDE